MKTKSYRFILNQNESLKDAFSILNKMFFDKGEVIEKIELLSTGEMKVTVNDDIRW